MTDPFDVALLASLSRLRGYAISLTRDSTAGEDLAQDTLVRALSRREQFIIGSSMAAWLCTICLNQFRDDRRRTWRTAPLDEAAYALTAEAPDDPLTCLELKQVCAALNQMSQHFTEPLRLRFEGYSYAEASDRIGLKPATVKQRVSRGRDELEARTHTGRRRIAA